MNFIQTQFPTSFIQQPENISIVEQLLVSLTSKKTNKANKIKQYILQTTSTGVLAVSFANQETQYQLLQNYAKEYICGYQTFISKDTFEETNNKIQITKIDFVPSAKCLEKCLNKSNDNSNESCLNDIQKKLLQQTKETELLQYQITETNGKKEFTFDFVRKNIEIRELQTMLLSVYELCQMKNVEITNCSFGMNCFYEIENFVAGTFAFKLNTEENIENNYYHFINELISLPFTYQLDTFTTELKQKGTFTPLEITLVKALANLSEQFLSNINVDLFTLTNIQEAFIFHAPITRLIIDLFALKFNPYYYTKYSIETEDVTEITEEREQQYNDQWKKVQEVIRAIDTGRMKNDNRRKTVLEFVIVIINNILKTNYYVLNKISLGFRLNPIFIEYLDTVHDLYNYDYTETKRKAKFPEIPFGAFYVYSNYFFGFQIRFRDLARGGLRTVINRDMEMYNYQRIRIFEECYNLSYTQQKKNKDIPEGGSKAIIFLMPNGIECNTTIIENKLELLETEMEKTELFDAKKYTTTMRNAYLYANQKRFLVTFLSLINFELLSNNPKKSYQLKEQLMLDYVRQPEFIYLGPDENMHDCMIDWLSKESIKVNYFCGGAFISGKEETGINHKEYGVTSIGVFEFMKIGLEYLKLDTYSIKITGGPNGDVAGNLIHLIKLNHENICKIKSICSSVCVVLDNEGININELDTLFLNNKALQFFDVNKLHNEGFMLRLDMKQVDQNCVEQYKIFRMKENTITEEWIDSTTAMKLYETTVHQNEVDVFAPCGGRPFSLNENNVDTFFINNNSNKRIPSCKLIVEGANLYFTPKAREILEQNGVVIFKDSSANKCGVVSSSYEILGGLGLDDEQFIAVKKEYAKGIITRLKVIAQEEGRCMIDAYTKKYSTSMVKISEEMSRKINEITDDINTLLLNKDLFEKQNEKYLNIFIQYIPQVLLQYKDQLLKRIPQMHMKAIIATSLATKIIYSKGLMWKVSIVDIIDTIL